MSNEGTTVACIGLGRMGARFARNSFAERVRFGSEVNARGHEFERLLAGKHWRRGHVRRSEGPRPTARRPR